MNFDLHVPGIAGVIQLSIAPVFLLTAIGALLGVLSTRLARAIDRARQLEERLSGFEQAARASALDELHWLSRRVRWVNRAIAFSTACALLVCLVIATLFAGAVLERDLSPPAVMFFLLAVVSLTIGLLCFLREIYLATRHIRIGEHRPGF